MSLDMKRFRDLTLGKTVVMGRKTFETIGKALPGRINIVLTREANWKAADVLVAPNTSVVFELAKGDELMIIGGAEVYREFLPLANRLELTAIDLEFSGDTFFPDYYKDGTWETVTAVDHEPDEKNLYSCRFLTLQKKAA